MIGFDFTSDWTKSGTSSLSQLCRVLDVTQLLFHIKMKTALSTSVHQAY